MSFMKKKFSFPLTSNYICEAGGNFLRGLPNDTDRGEGNDEKSSVENVWLNKKVIFYSRLDQELALFLK